jgi:hypothetical protein
MSGDLATRPCDVVAGDATQPIEMVPLASDGVSQMVDVSDGDALPLVAPPQGGFIVYAAARARNLNACEWTVEGRLVDPASGDEIGFERRTLVKVAVGSDGWARPELPLASAFANIPACPDYAMTDLQGQPVTLQVTITDDKGVSATAMRTVVPTCTQSDPGARQACVCECSAEKGALDHLCGD